MASVDMLAEKLLGESRREASALLDKARDEARRAEAQAEADARAQASALLEEARREAERAAAQITQAGALAVRDKALAAKRAVLDRVFDEALARLEAMPEAEYRQYVTDYVTRADAGDGEISFPARYGITDVAWLNDKLRAAGKKSGLTLGPAIPEGGFVLRRGGVERNHTFAALIAYYRQELEGEALAILYS